MTHPLRQPTFFLPLASADPAVNPGQYVTPLLNDGWDYAITATQAAYDAGFRVVIWHRPYGEKLDGDLNNMALDAKLLHDEAEAITLASGADQAMADALTQMPDLQLVCYVGSARNVTMQALVNDEAAFIARARLAIPALTSTHPRLHIGFDHSSTYDENSVQWKMVNATRFDKDRIGASVLVESIGQVYQRFFPSFANEQAYQAAHVNGDGSQTASTTLQIRRYTGLGITNVVDWMADVLAQGHVPCCTEAEFTASGADMADVLAAAPAAPTGRPIVIRHWPRNFDDHDWFRDPSPRGEAWPSNMYTLLPMLPRNGNGLTTGTAYTGNADLDTPTTWNVAGAVANLTAACNAWATTPDKRVGLLVGNALKRMDNDRFSPWRDWDGGTLAQQLAAGPDFTGVAGIYEALGEGLYDAGISWPTIVVDDEYSWTWDGLISLIALQRTGGFPYSPISADQDDAEDEIAGVLNSSGARTYLATLPDDDGQAVIGRWDELGADAGAAALFASRVRARTEPEFSIWNRAARSAVCEAIRTQIQVPFSTGNQSPTQVANYGKTRGLTDLPLLSGTVDLENQVAVSEDFQTQVGYIRDNVGTVSRPAWYASGIDQINTQRNILANPLCSRSMIWVAENAESSEDASPESVYFTATTMQHHAAAGVYEYLGFTGPGQDTHPNLVEQALTIRARSSFDRSLPFAAYTDDPIVTGDIRTAFIDLYPNARKPTMSLVREAKTGLIPFNLAYAFDQTDLSGGIPPIIGSGTMTVAGNLIAGAAGPIDGDRGVWFGGNGGSTNSAAGWAISENGDAPPALDDLEIVMVCYVQEKSAVNDTALATIKCTNGDEVSIGAMDTTGNLHMIAADDSASSNPSRRTNTTPATFGTGSPYLGQWVTICCRFDPDAGNFKCWINGVDTSLSGLTKVLNNHNGSATWVGVGSESTVVGTEYDRHMPPQTGVYFLGLRWGATQSERPLDTDFAVEITRAVNRDRYEISQDQFDLLTASTVSAIKTTTPVETSVSDVSVNGSVTATSFNTSQAGLFRVGDLIQQDGSREVMLATQVTGVGLTVIRGYGGTTPEALVNGGLLRKVGHEVASKQRSKAVAAGATDQDVYFLFRNAAGEVWDGSAFVTFTSVDYADYAVAATEQNGTGFYEASIPSASSVVAQAKVQSGASPAETDNSVGITRLV